MSKDYFTKFGTIDYANVEVVDITKRESIRQTVTRDKLAYYPLTVRPGMRADQVADMYYGDPAFSWLVYLSANIIDPYYDWVLDSRSFDHHIDVKYGSFVDAQKKILFWRTNWPAHAEDDISLAGYDALTDGARKYWDAIYGDDSGSLPIKYVRRREDWTASTNMVVAAVVTASNGDFQTGEQVSFRFSANNTESGNAVCLFVNSSVLSVQHVFGNVSPNAGFYAVGLDSNATANCSRSTVLKLNIPQAEVVYWEPIYALDRETERNEDRKHMMLLDAKYADEVDRELTESLA